MNRLQLILPVLFIGVSHYLFSQQLSLFTQYREHLTILNPASVGAMYFSNEHNLMFGASYRAQWAGFENAPTTATIHADLFNPNGGTVSLIAGGYIMNDQTGPTGFTGIYGRVGALISGDPYYGGFSAGISLGAVQYRVNTSDLRLVQENDILANDDQRKLYPDVGFGLFGYKMLDGGAFNNDYIYGGISVPQVMGLDLTFKNESGDFYTRRTQHLYAMLGMYKFFRNDSYLEPSVWFKYTQNAPVNVDFNLRYQMPQNFWIGIGGASSKTLHIETGVVVGENLGFDNSLKIGYSYDYSFSSFGPFTGGSHEINISYSLER
jgi:type IX secretion system PorP/SprF family membrane protein